MNSALESYRSINLINTVISKALSRYEYPIFEFLDGRLDKDFLCDGNMLDRPRQAW